MRICLEFCQQRKLGWTRCFIFQVVCTFARDRSASSQWTFTFQKTNSGAALKEFKSSLHRMKDLQCFSQIKPPVLISRMPSPMLKTILFLQPIGHWINGMTFFQWIKTLSSLFIVCISLNCVCRLWSLGSCSGINSNPNEEPTTCFCQSQKDFTEEANLWYDLHETKPTQKRLWERGRWAEP